MLFDKPFNLDRTVRLCITIVIVIALFMLTRQLSGVLLPFVVSWFIAYLLHPIVNFLQHKVRLKNRTLSVFVTLTIVVALLTLLIVLLVHPVKLPSLPNMLVDSMPTPYCPPHGRKQSETGSVKLIFRHILLARTSAS